MKVKKSVVASAIVLLVIFVLGGCSTTGKVSSPAQNVIQAMMTCPNEKLFDPEMVGAVGEGVSFTDEEKAQMQELRDEVDANWKALVGEYFSEDSFEQFHNRDYFLSRNVPVEVKKMELLEKDDSYENVKVKLLVDSEEKEVLVKLGYNPDGKIWKVEIVE